MECLRLRSVLLFAVVWITIAYLRNDLSLFTLHNRQNLLRCPAFLPKGTSLCWPESKPHLKNVRIGGAMQFCHHYLRCIGFKSPKLVWGDEIEFGIFSKDESFTSFDLATSSGTKAKRQLTDRETLTKNLSIGCSWQPEYGSWMVEAVPRNPFGVTVSDLENVEKSMLLRRKRLHNTLANNEIAPSITNFPMMGVSGYPHTFVKSGDVSNSAYISDEVINREHPRFATLTKNIRMRRGSNVDVLVQRDKDDFVFRKDYVKQTIDNDTIKRTSASNDKSSNDNNIHMDAMAFGMGMCCLQVTQQCQDEQESRFLHDQLAVFAPVLLALSAATPIIQGQLAATDTRWDVIAQSVDDRTVAERGRLHVTDNDRTDDDGFDLEAGGGDPQLVGNGVRKLSQSRYSDSALFIAQAATSEQQLRLDYLNNYGTPSIPAVHAAIDEDVYRILHEDNHIDKSLSMHIAHLFTRDPLVIYDDQLDMDNTKSLDHFENIQSTNWRSMRWKPPSLEVGFKQQQQSRIAAALNNKKTDSVESLTSSVLEQPQKQQQQQHVSENLLVEEKLKLDEDKETTSSSSSSNDLGWRVEFRPLELQLTDYENAAYAVFVVLLSRCILQQGHNFYMPMNYVHENMRRAQLKDAVITQKFWFNRNSLNTLCNISNVSSKKKEEDCYYYIPSSAEIDLVELSVDEIINGEKEKRFDSMNNDSHIKYCKYDDDSVINYKNRQDSISSEGSDINSNESVLSRRYSGILPQIKKYIQHLSATATTVATTGHNSLLLSYLSLIQGRSTGALPTTARWMRDFIRNHKHPENSKSYSSSSSSGGGNVTVENDNSSISQPQQNHDNSNTDTERDCSDNESSSSSISSRERCRNTTDGTIGRVVADALLQRCEDIGMGRIHCPQLYGAGSAILFRSTVDKDGHCNIGSGDSNNSGMNVNIHPLEGIGEDELIF